MRQEHQGGQAGQEAEGQGKIHTEGTGYKTDPSSPCPRAHFVQLAPPPNKPISLMSMSMA